MNNVNEMENKIISVLGYEHPDTVYFFELCSNNDISLYYLKFLKRMFDIIMAVNTPNLKHIHYSINHIYGDIIYDTKCIEIDGAISYTSLIRTIPTGGYEYVSILGIVQ